LTAAWVGLRARDISGDSVYIGDVTVEVAGLILYAALKRRSSTVALVSAANRLLLSTLTM
jgi:hypothetical protein